MDPEFTVTYEASVHKVPVVAAAAGGVRRHCHHQSLHKFLSEAALREFHSLPPCPSKGYFGVMFVFTAVSSTPLDSLYLVYPSIANGFDHILYRAVESIGQTDCVPTPYGAVCANIDRTLSKGLVEHTYHAKNSKCLKSKAYNLGVQYNVLSKTI